MSLAAAILHLYVGKTLSSGIRYEAWTGARGRYHVIRVAPHAAHRARPSVAAKGRAPLLRLAGGGVAAINGGYFDTRSGAPVSWVLTRGQVVSDPKRNLRLMGNPRLWPFLGAITSRTEWRALKSGKQWRWELARHGAPTPKGWTLYHALQAGPRLLPSPGITAEAFVRPGRDAINTRGRAARSGIGFTPSGEMLLVMSPNGQTLAQFREALIALKCRQAMALDGGSSSQLCWRDAKGWHRIGAGEQNRPNKIPDLVSALVIGP